MFYLLTETLTDIVIDGLRRYWSIHPKYKDDLVPNIQGKFSFSERPQTGMIVKPSGSNKVPLTWDNFIGHVQSRVRLTKVPNKVGLALEWVLEDNKAIQDNDFRMPSDPGVYFIDIVDGPTNGLTTDFGFYVDPFIEVPLESHKPVSDSIFLKNIPIPKTILMYECPINTLLEEGVDFEVVLDGNGAPTNEIRFLSSIPSKHFISTQYKVGYPVLGPFEITPNYSNNTAIPGVVLAFGTFLEVGDRMAVVVEPQRTEVALEYGGRWTTNFEIDIMARDIRDQRIVADRTAVWLFGVFRSYLSSRGVQLADLSIGGESEEIYDENGDDYFYNCTISFSLESEWFIWVPLDVTIRDFNYNMTYSAFSLQPLEDPFYRSKFKGEGIK